MTVEIDRQFAAPQGQSQTTKARTYSVKRRVVRHGIIALAGGIAAALVMVSLSLFLPVSASASTLLLAIAVGSVIGITHIEQVRSPQNHARQRIGVSSGTVTAFRAASDTDIITHELESAIFAIQRLVSVGELSEPTEGQRTVLRGIKSESDYLRTLLNDLRTVSDLEHSVLEVHPRPCDLKSLLAPVIQTVQAVSGGHDIQCVIEREMTVYADPDRIGQVIRNLLLNAAKYSARNSSIMIRASEVGSLSRIEVIDEGIGFSLEDRDRIFKPFDRGSDIRKHQFGGYGLGLYISQRITNLHGSRLQAASAPGGGSIFSFSLEIVDDPDTYRR